ncbi:MAG: hypothetical protein GKC53_03850 [Neisseriaceae bacterium]|nr:MAG: hypothetical protein GKC53_03850 [Neisseriaceae bacterium]
MRHLALCVIGFLFLEVISIVMLASMIGGVWLLAIIVTFFFIGIFMFKHQGANVQKMFASLQSNTLDQTWYSKVGPIRYNLAALLFILPGIFSDIIGLIFLLPGGLGKGYLKIKPYNPFSKTKNHRYDQPEDGIIEGKFREVFKEKKEE